MDYKNNNLKNTPDRAKLWDAFNLASQKSIPVDNISIGERLDREISEDDIASMQKSLDIEGLLSPIVVKYKNGGGYELISGFIRLTAAKRNLEAAQKEWGDKEKTPEAQHELGRFQNINAIILAKNTHPDVASLYEATENLERKELSPTERAKWAAIREKARNDVMGVKGKSGDLATEIPNGDLATEIPNGNLSTKVPNGNLSTKVPKGSLNQN